MLRTPFGEERMNTDDAWRAWGERDPYFAVLTNERYRKENLDAHRADFFASGRREIDEALGRYQRYFGELPGGSALDFGCGVGRLALALGERFERVVGMDIAPAMLAEARANAKAAGQDCTTFVLSDDTLSNAPGQFDFVNTCLVLQHIPTARGLRIVRHLLDRVAPGGGCQIHVSVQRRPVVSRKIAYWMRFHVPFGNYLFNLVAGRPTTEPPMQLNEYPLDVMFRMFCNAGMHEVVAVAAEPNGYLTLSLIARKPAPRQ